MSFSANQILTAAQLNDLSIDSLGVGTSSPETPVTIVTTNKLGSSFTGTTDGEGLRVDQSDYVADNYVSLVEASYDDGQTEPHVRVGAQFTSGGSKLAFGTTNNYGNGITNQALTIDPSGKVGIATTTPDHVLELNQISGGEQDLLSCHNDNGAEGFRVAASVVRSATIANTTTGSSANVFVSTSSNTLFRSTVSALKYKTNVETMEDSYADAILGLRPVWYRSRCELDPESYGYWGFIAEEVAEVDPRIVTFGVADDYEWQYDEDGEKIEPDVADLTEPEGVQYDRLVPHLVNLLARQRDQIADLEQRVAALEAT